MRLYLTPTELNSFPVGMMMAGRIAQLAALNTGAVEGLLARASKRVDAYCHKRIGAPLSSTVGSGGIVAGSTSLPVSSTLGYDDDQEQAIIIGSGGTQEILPILPGGVSVTSWTSPYPGTIQLAQPVSYSHSAGETVQGCYQEVSTVGSSNSFEPYSGSIFDLSQDAQLAYAHNAPYVSSGNLTRLIFLKQYPIVSLYRLEHQLPFATGQYNSVGTTGIGINNASGFLRLPIGSYVLENGLFRSTYLAGYQAIPDVIKEATAAYFAASMLAFVNTYGVIEESQGKHRTKWSDGKTPAYWQSQAELLLCGSEYVRRT